MNPRKLYLVDHGLAQAFSPVTGLDRGRLIENLVACELSRVSRDLAYAKTAAPHGSRTPQGIEIVPVWQWLLGCG